MTFISTFHLRKGRVPEIAKTTSVCAGADLPLG